MREVANIANVKGSILERDEHIPPLAELIPELQTAREILAKHPSATSQDSYITPRG
jgi:uncharacterized protein (UPF0276 family)